MAVWLPLHSCDPPPNCHFGNQNYLRDMLYDPTGLTPFLDSHKNCFALSRRVPASLFSSLIAALPHLPANLDTLQDRAKHCIAMNPKMKAITNSIARTSTKFP